MAVQQSQVLPAPFIEEAGKDYLSQLKGLTSIALDTSKFAPSVAGQDPLQTQAAALAGDTGATGLGGYQQYLTAAQNLTGPQAYKPYMTPYQTDVIDATLTEYDKQTQLQEQSLRDQQAKLGVLGAGRAGVQLGEYGAQRGLDRATLQARMLQDAFTQAQGLATTNESSTTTTITSSRKNWYFGSSGRKTTGSSTSSSRCYKRTKQNGCYGTL